MFEAMFEINVAIVMVVVAAVLFVWFRRNEAAASARRMTSMIARIGLAPRIAARRDPRTAAVVSTARRRCEKCPREDLCERWLAGSVEGDNAFCPNARTFGILARTGAS